MSLRSIVPWIAPRTKAARCRIIRSTSCRSRSATRRFIAAARLIHASFTASQTSRVSAVRTTRALSRAALTTDSTDDGLSASRSIQSIASSRVTIPCLAT